MSNMIKGFVISTIIFMLTGCAPNSATNFNANGNSVENNIQPVENRILVSHMMGETSVPVNPQRVVVFDYGTLDTFEYLGINVIGIPKSGRMPDYLSSYANNENITDVGTLHEPNFEVINELEPDLIIISGRQRDSYEELSKIAPTIFLGVDNSNYLQSFKQNVMTIGELFNKQNEVLNRLEDIESRIETISNLVIDKQVNALIVLYNEGSFSAYGSGSRFGIIHDVLKFVPADQNIEVSTHGMNVTNEYILDINPDYLFIIDRNTLSSDSKEIAKDEIENEIIKMTDAYQSGNISYLPLDHWYLSGGGLISVALMLDDIEASLK